MLEILRSFVLLMDSQDLKLTSPNRINKAMNDIAKFFLYLARITMKAFIIIMLFLQHVESQTCIGTCYSGDVSPKTQDTFLGKYLKNHSYKNITTDDQGKCYRHCVQDCRCKACQMKDTRCELLDEDKTSKAGDFVDGPGYVYFDLRQTMYQGVRM